MMVESDSRRLMVILFSVALVLGAGVAILAFLAGRRSEAGKIHPPDFAALPTVQAANPPPSPVQIVPLPEGSLVREEAPPTPGTPVVIGYDGGQPITMEADGNTVATGAPLEDTPAIVIRRHESIRPRARSVSSQFVTPVAPVSPEPIPVEPSSAPPAPSAAPAPPAAEPDVATPPPPPPAAAPAPEVDPPLDSSLDSSVEPAPPPP